MAAVLQAPTESFAALVGIAKLDPARDLKSADLRNVNFRTDDLTGFDFANADVSGADFSQALGLQPSMFVDAVHDASTKWPSGFHPLSVPDGPAHWAPARSRKFQRGGPHVGVLPLQLVGTTEEESYLAPGLAEEITAALARFRCDLRARFQFTGALRGRDTRRDGDPAHLRPRLPARRLHSAGA